MKKKNNKIKTYSQTKGKGYFDWNAFLNKEIITDEEWYYANDRAGDWVTCACGNQCTIISRDLNGEPNDEQLADLGGDFYYSITQRDVKQAKRTLAKIEKRSLFLIKQMYRKAKKEIKIYENILH